MSLGRQWGRVKLELIQWYCWLYGVDGSMMKVEFVLYFREIDMSVDIFVIYSYRYFLNLNVVYFCHFYLSLR